MILQVNSLKVDFHTNRGLLHAVRDVSFSLGKGEFLGIVGESGSGKSVTASSILNLIPPNGRVYGEIFVNGKNTLLMDRKELLTFRGKDIAMIFQEPGRSFDPIANMINTFLETYKAHEPEISREEAEERTIKLLKEVHLPRPEERLSNYPHQFSGGQLQRIMIALALASNPEILIADEPTTALDVTIQAGIVSLLEELRKERNLAVMFITHNIELVSRLADRIIVMYSGLVMEENTSSGILHKPHHPYTLGLLNSLPEFGNHYSTHKLSSIPGSIPDPIDSKPGCPFAPRCGLAGESCFTELPPFHHSDGNYRCIIEGSKAEMHHG